MIKPQDFYGVIYFLWNFDERASRKPKHPLCKEIQFMDFFSEYQLPCYGAPVEVWEWLEPK